MASVSDVLSRALRLIGSLDPDEDLEPSDITTGIPALNAMCSRWEANGNAMGWNDVENPSDLIPSPPQYDACIAFNLALEIAPEYDATPTNYVMRRAEELLAELRRDNAVATPIEPILDVPMPQSHGAHRLGFPGDWYG